MENWTIPADAIRTCPEWAKWADSRERAILCKECNVLYEVKHWSLWRGPNGGWTDGIPDTDHCPCCKRRADEEARLVLPIDLDLVRRAREYAKERYDRSYGWQEIVECYEDDELWKVIAGSKNLKEAVKKMRDVVDLRTERYNEIQSTVW